MKWSQRVPLIAALFFVFQTLLSYGQQRVDVVVQSYRFQPQEVRIQLGDTVRWLNREKRTSHSIVFSDVHGGESERFFPDESWQRRFDRPGVYPYHCGPHPEMTGTVVVLAPAEPVACHRAEPSQLRQVRIAPDKSSVEIMQADVLVKRLVLRPNLLMDVHYFGNGRHALLATRDGWILRLDLEQAQPTAETKLNLAVSSTALSGPKSSQGLLLAVASETSSELIILDENLQLVKTLAVLDKTGRIRSGLVAVRTAEARDSFVAVLADAPELWEISYNPKAPEISLGMVHDFQYREGQFVPGYLNAQRSTLPSTAQDFVLLGSGHEVLTIHSEAVGRRDASLMRLHVMHLDVRKPAAEWTPVFYPDQAGWSWWQVDPQTLPAGASMPMLQVDKSTLRFIDQSHRSGKHKTDAKRPQQPCVGQPVGG